MASRNTTMLGHPTFGPEPDIELDDPLTRIEPFQSLGLAAEDATPQPRRHPGAGPCPVSGTERRAGA